MLVIVYNLLKNIDVYKEEKFEIARQKQESARINKLAVDAERLGFKLVRNEEQEQAA